jgi:hypothetical protein
MKYITSRARMGQICTQKAVSEIKKKIGAAELAAFLAGCDYAYWDIGTGIRTRARMRKSYYCHDRS